MKDATNNTLTCVTNHATLYAVVYPTSRASSSSTASTSSSGGGGASLLSTPTLQTGTTAKTQTLVTPKAAEGGVTTGVATDRATQVQRIVAEAKILVGAKIADLLRLTGAKRDLAREQNVGKTLVPKILGKTNVPSSTRYALINFIAYGTPESKALGDGERAGIVSSFQSAFDKFPSTEEDWSNVLKIGAGRWPSKTAPAKEAESEALFMQIYKRKANRKNQNDEAAIAIMTYGLRPTKRDINKERAAIQTFKNVFKKAPIRWDVVRAIANSGAKR
jgi:hypothetical protein